MNAKRLLFSFLAVLVSLTVTGCFTKTQKDTSIPWSRPANWEGQVPGMGSTPGQGR